MDGKIQKATAVVPVLNGAALEIKQTTNPSRDSSSSVREEADRKVDQENGELERLKNFKEELLKAGPTNIVEPGAQISVCVDGQKQDILVMSTRVSFLGILVCTPQSPLVAAIMGGLRGFSTTYEVGPTEHTVQILDIH